MIESVNQYPVVPSAAPTTYAFQIDPESDSTHARVIRLVGSGKDVLELGCASGYMSRVLRDHSCRIVGIELNPAMATEAATICDRVIVGNIEQLDLTRELGDAQFDVIVAADFLEHLRDPLALLRTLTAFLRPEGYLVASIPNTAHGSVRLALLQGHFPYAELGLLDRTHLRFFTRETVEELLLQAGLLIGHLERQELQITASEVPFDPAAAPPDLLARLEQDPEARTYQFILVAYRLPPGQFDWLQQRWNGLLERCDVLGSEVVGLRRALAEQEAGARAEIAGLRQALSTQEASAREEIAGLRQALAEQEAGARAEIASLRQTLSEQEDQSQHLDELTMQLSAVTQRDKELRARLLEVHDQLLRRDTEVQRFSQECEMLRRELDLQQRQQQEVAARLQRILGSWPLRLYSRLQFVPGLRRAVQSTILRSAGR